MNKADISAWHSMSVRNKEDGNIPVQQACKNLLMVVLPKQSSCAKSHQLYKYTCSSYGALKFQSALY